MRAHAASLLDAGSRGGGAAPGNGSLRGGLAALVLGATGLFRVREGRFRYDQQLDEAALDFPSAAPPPRDPTGCWRRGSTAGRREEF